MSEDSKSREREDASMADSDPPQSEPKEEITETPDRLEPVQPESHEGAALFEASAVEDEEEPPNWLIDNIGELSQNARSIYLIYLGFLAYCSIAVVSSSDRQILLNESVRLPIIGVDVSFTGFFVIAPLVALSTFIYLQLYLQRLTRLKEMLRTEYKPVKIGRLYPWMLNITDNPDPGMVGWLQRNVVKMVLWWSLPIVMFIFSIWYLKAQAFVTGILVSMLPALGVVTALYFRHLYQDVDYSFLDSMQIDPVKRSIFIGGSIVQLIIILIFFLSVLGVSPRFGFGVATIDVSYQSLVTERERARYWVNLKGKNLNGANLQQAILINADLRQANLRGANLSGARLDSADLRGASLGGSILRAADMEGAVLRNANLENARMQGAHLVNAQLQNAYLKEANLDSAKLRSARLQRATLEDAHLNGADLSEARLQETDLENSRLYDAILEGAHLKTNPLVSVNSGRTFAVQLEGAHLMDLTLKSPLCDTSSSHIKWYRSCSKNPSMISVVVDELCSASSLRDISTEPEILAGVKRKCPHLLSRSSEN